MLTDAFLHAPSGQFKLRLADGFKPFLLIFPMGEDTGGSYFWDGLKAPITNHQVPKQEGPRNDEPPVFEVY